MLREKLSRIILYTVLVSMAMSFVQAQVMYPGEVELLGAEEIVFDYTTDACDSEDIPDVPAQAFRDVDNNIQLIATHMTSYRMIGSDFSSLTRDCANGPVFESGHASDAATYNNDEWLAGVYTPDGETIYSFVHNEYKPNGAENWEHSWYNTITFATSTDTGRTYTQAASPNHYLAGIPYQYQYGAPMGIFGGSSPVYNEEDGYYYAMLHLESFGLQEWGTGIIRTQTLSDPDSWRGWDGSGFNVQFVDAYNETVDDPANHILAPVSRDNISKMSASLTYNTYFEKFMVVDFFNKYDATQGRMVYGLYYSLSDDLINWSSSVLILESDVNGWGAGGIYYPSIIDHDDTSRNFERPDQEAYIYYTKWNSGTYDRDLCRMPIRFTKNMVSSFTVNSIGDDEGANIGLGYAQTGNLNSAGDPEVTLRSAIFEALASPDTNYVFPINFDIPGDGPHVIAINSFLPSIDQPIIIDGFSQSGASPNTLSISEGNNAVIMIELDGTATGGAVGITLTGENATIKGLALHSFGSGFAFEEASNSTVEGCFIGFDASGTEAGDAIGVEFWKSDHNMLGGTLPENQNIIRGQIEMEDPLTTDNEIRGNYIGTNLAGTASAGSGTVMMYNYVSNTIVDGNLISGTYRGIDLSTGAQNNVITNNIMGTDKTGSIALNSGLNGVIIYNGAIDNTIGTPGNGNIISGWSDGGVYVMGATSTGNIFQANTIGTNADGADLGNGYPGGILFFEGANNTTIGGLNSDEANVIAYNTNAGIIVGADAGTGNAILGNAIYANGFGIDVGGDGVTENDGDDSDVGPNNYQNKPEISSAVLYTDQTIIEGSLSSIPESNYRIELFQNTTISDGIGQGEVFIASMDVTTDASGTADIQFDLAYELTAGYFVTMTATDANNNTSEFSAPYQVTGEGVAPIISVSSIEVNFELSPSQMLDENITIGNTGTIDLSYEATANVGWVRLSNDDATVAPGASTLLNITVDPAGMVSGTHYGSVFINSNDPETPNVEIAVSMTINGDAIVSVNPGALSMDMSSGGDVSDTLFISNVGNTLMEYYLHTSDEFIVVTPDWNNVQAGATDTVIVFAAGGSVTSGIYSGWIRVDSNDPNTTSVMVDLEIFVDMNGPLFSANPSSFDLVIPQQSTYYDTITISNSGTETLTWSGGSSFTRVSLEPSSGSITAGSFETVVITVNAIGLGAGTYPQFLNFTTNDPGQPSPSIPFNVEIVAPNPEMFLNQSNIMVEVPGGAIVNDTLILSNSGDANLDWSITEEFSWFDVAPMSGFVVPGGSTEIIVTLNAVGTSAGTFNGNFEITSNDPNNSNVSVPVQMTVGSDAEITLSVDTLFVNMDLGQDNASTQFSITNDGSSNLDVSLSADVSSPWISLNPANPPSIASNGVEVITVNISGTGFEEGIYTGAVIIASNDADESELSLPVIVTVGDGVANPEIRINSPSDGFVTEADSVDIYYTVNNFAVDFTPNGDGYVKFQLDDNSEGNRFSTNTLTLRNLESGQHVFMMWLVDNNGDMLSPHVSDTLYFSVSSSSPVIALNPDQLGFSLEVGSTVNDTIMIVNNGLSNLEWTVQDTTPWISVDNSGAMLEPYIQMPIVVTINTLGMMEGYYESSLVFASDDPANPTYVVPVTLNLFGVPVIDVDTTPLQYEMSSNTVMEDTLVVNNLGTGILDWQLGNTAPWLAYNLNNDQILNGEQSEIIVTIDSDGLDVGVYADTLTFTSNDEMQDVVQILVSLEILGAPSIFVENTLLSYEIEEDSSVVDTLVIENFGSANLTWTVGNQSTWLSYAISSGDVDPNESADFIISIASTGLAPATYTDTIIVTSNDVANPVVEIPVELVVLPSVSIENRTGIPNEYTLNQNYPNPFNPTTTFSFGLPEAAEVSIAIYDIRGNIVKVVNAGYANAGWYQYTWNGQDENGQLVSTGVYLARMQTPSYAKTIKMLYLK